MKSTNDLSASGTQARSTWLTLRRLHGINPHVQIFVSIRKEAYQHAAQNEPQFSNLRSFRRELRRLQNRGHQTNHRKQHSNCQKAIWSTRATKIPCCVSLGRKMNSFRTRNGATRAGDKLWTRHCSLRPRDAIVIGKEISLIGVKRRSQQEIRTRSTPPQRRRVETLFNEVAPFFSGLYPEIFPQVIKSNV